MNNNKQVVEAPGAKEPKKQKKSVGYALKAIILHVETLVVSDTMSKEDEIKVAEILKRTTEKYIKREYGI